MYLTAPCTILPKNVLARHDEHGGAQRGWLSWLKAAQHVNAPVTTNITGTPCQVRVATRFLRLHISQHGHYSNPHKGGRYQCIL
jgi:hypothetical protein